MNFDDEDYVRLYVRDTVTWKLLGWQGRTVLLHMLRGKFDRAGIFVTDRHATSRAVTAATELPAEVVEEGLRQVLAENVWIEADGALVWPTFVEAQTAVRSEKARQRDLRKRRAAERVATDTALQPVTIRDGSVTPRHAPSRRVTLAEQSLAEQSLADAPPNPQSGGGKVRCPRDLSLTPGQVSQAEMQGVSREAVESLTARFRGSWCDRDADLRSLDQWRSGLNTMVHRDGREETIRLKKAAPRDRGYVCEDEA
jgi:hypothetical protein